jgi:hypothetical protein
VNVYGGDPSRYSFARALASARARAAGDGKSVRRKQEVEGTKYPILHFANSMSVAQLRPTAAQLARHVRLYGKDGTEHVRTVEDEDASSAGGAPRGDAS